MTLLELSEKYNKKLNELCWDDREFYINFWPNFSQLDGNFTTSQLETILELQKELDLEFYKNMGK